MAWPREKLVRHRIPEIIRENGETCETRIADPTEMPTLLATKLLEEVAEFAQAQLAANRQRMIEELTDVMEVVRCLREMLGEQAVWEASQERMFDRGRLSYRIVLKLESSGG